MDRRRSFISGGAPRKATLIVLSWNNWALTRRTLDTLRETNLFGAEVIVVDNGSTDGSSENLTDYEAWLSVLRLPENVGFVLGNNAGIEVADPESDIVLLNNDLIFTQTDWLQRLRELAHADPKNGIVGCRLTLADGRLLHAGTYVLPDTCWGQQIESGSLEKDVNQYRRDRVVQGIVFAVAYIRRETIRAIGGLCTDFTTYFEDTDYCLRAKEAGFDTLLCGSATVVHTEHGSTGGESAQREKLFFAGQAVFRKKWKQKLDDAYRHEVLWQSIMNFPTGYATSSRAFLRGLDQIGIRMVYEYVYGEGSPFPLDEPADSRDYRLNVLRSRKIEGTPKLSIVYGQGDVFERARGAIRVGFTMLEVDGFPAEWVRQANSMDEVWVPSAFNRDAYLACGLSRPVRIMPLGVDPDYFHPGIKGHPNPDNEYVFLANFEWGERKEPALLLRTFNRVFKNSDNVRLIAKINNRDPGVDLDSELRKLKLSAAGGRISFLINREFPYYQLGSLYKSANCYVSAGRGEGWDMPLMEAMACGLATIATDWGAHKEFVHPGISFPLAIRGTIAAKAKCPYYEGFAWADPDEEHLAHLLRYVYENQAVAEGVGRAAADEVASRWTWNHAVGVVAGRIEELLA